MASEDLLQDPNYLAALATGLLRQSDAKKLIPRRPSKVLDSLASLLIHRQAAQVISIGVAGPNADGHLVYYVASNEDLTHTSESVTHLSDILNTLRKVRTILQSVCIEASRGANAVDEVLFYSVEPGTTDIDADSAAKLAAKDELHALHLRVLTHSWHKIKRRLTKHSFNTLFTTFAQTIGAEDVEATLDGHAYEKELRKLLDAERALPEGCTLRRVSGIISHLTDIFAKGPEGKYLEGACALLTGLSGLSGYHKDNGEDSIFELAKVAGLNWNCARWIEKVTQVTTHFFTVANVPLSTKHAAFTGPFSVHPVACPPISYTYPVDTHSIRQVIRRAATASGAADPDELTGDESIQAFKNWISRASDTITGTDIRPHCECALLLALYAEPKVFGYIGTSKLTCEACHLYFKAYRSRTSNGLHTRGSHGLFTYIPRWVYPALPDATLDSAVREELCTLLLKKVYDAAWNVEVDRRERAESGEFEGGFHTAASLFAAFQRLRRARDLTERSEG